jgi:hypothetical protein
MLFPRAAIGAALLLALMCATANAAYWGPGKTTLSCIDHDGDGYGTGPGCAGRDADDSDAAVNTVASWKAKYGTIDALLAARGYVGILRYWFLDYANGSDATCKPGTSDVAEANPCATWDKFRLVLKPGDAVILRAGQTPTGSRFPMTVSGTATNPIFLLGYPGEQFTLDRSNKPDGTAVGDGVAGTNLHDIVIEDFSIYTKEQYGNGININITPKNVTVRGMEIRGGYSGLRMFDGLLNVVIAKNFFTESKGTESVYLGSRGLPNRDVFFRRNIVRNVTGLGSGYPAVQHNGRVENYVVEGNIVYGAEQCFSWLQGVSKSVFLRNVCFGSTRAMLTIYNYPANQATDCTCAANAICPYDQVDNLIEYNTLVRPKYDRVGNLVGGNSNPVFNVVNTSYCVTGDLGRQTFRNNVVWGDGNMPLVQHNNVPDVAHGYIATTRFLNNVWYKADATRPQTIFRVSGSELTEQEFAPLAAEYTGNVVADPKFAHYDPAEWANPELADFHLQDSSPAAHAGAYAGAMPAPPPVEPPPPPPAEPPPVEPPPPVIEPRVKAYASLAVKPEPLMTAKNLACKAPNGTIGTLKRRQEDATGRIWWHVSWNNGCTGWVYDLPAVRPTE